MKYYQLPDQSEDWLHTVDIQAAHTHQPGDVQDHHHLVPGHHQLLKCWYITTHPHSYLVSVPVELDQELDEEDHDDDDESNQDGGDEVHEVIVINDIYTRFRVKTVYLDKRRKTDVVYSVC